jgi:hypothetical protein
VKVANEIRHPWKHFFHRRDDPPAHIMHERLWFTVLPFDAIAANDSWHLSCCHPKRVRIFSPEGLLV